MSKIKNDPKPVLVPLPRKTVSVQKYISKAAVGWGGHGGHRARLTLRQSEFESR